MHDDEIRGFAWDDPLSRPAHGQGHGGAAYPSEAGAIGRLQFQVEELYKRLNSRDIARPLRVPLFEATASMPGALTAGADSTLYYPPFAMQLLSVTVSLFGLGSSSTTVKIWKNLSTLLDTITIGSGVRVVTREYATEFLPSDSFGFEIGTVGTSAQGLTAQGRFG